MLAGLAVLGAVGGVVAGVVVATGIAVHLLVERFTPQPSEALLRRLVFALLLCAAMRTGRKALHARASTCTARPDPGVAA